MDKCSSYDNKHSWYKLRCTQGILIYKCLTCKLLYQTPVSQPLKITHQIYTEAI